MQAEQGMEKLDERKASYHRIFSRKPTYFPLFVYLICNILNLIKDTAIYLRIIVDRRGKVDSMGGADLHFVE